MKEEVEAGAFDVVVAPTNTFEDLIKSGKLVAATRIGRRARRGRSGRARRRTETRRGLGRRIQAHAPRCEIRRLQQGRHRRHATLLDLPERLGISKDMPAELKSAVGDRPRPAAHFALVDQGRSRDRRRRRRHDLRARRRLRRADPFGAASLLWSSPPQRRQRREGTFFPSRVDQVRHRAGSNSDVRSEVDSTPSVTGTEGYCRV